MSPLLCLSAEMSRDWRETSTECLTVDKGPRIAGAWFSYVSCAAICHSSVAILPDNYYSIISCQNIYLRHVDRIRIVNGS